MSDSKTKTSLQQLLFGNPDVSSRANNLDNNLDVYEYERLTQDKNERPSAYVAAFEDAARAVYEGERHLLSPRERKMLEHYTISHYHARYVLCRLLLRKAGSWIPVKDMNKYIVEVGEDGLEQGIKDLCAKLDYSTLSQPSQPSQANSPQAPSCSFRVDEPNEYQPSQEEEVIPSSQPFPTQRDMLTRQEKDQDPLDIRFYEIINSVGQELALGFFCEDESSMELREILENLTVEQLQGLVKETKCKLKPKAKKGDMVDTLLSTTAKQGTLPFASESSSKGKGKARRDDGFRQTQLPFFTKNSSSAQRPTQEQRLKAMALKQLGPCLRVNFDFLRLVRRIHLIYYRETTHPVSILLPGLLSRFKKRNFTAYEYKRSDTIWLTRRDFLEYEIALELEQVLEELLDPTNDQVVRLPTATPAPGEEGDAGGQPSKTHATRNKEARMRRVVGITERWIYPRWQEYLHIQDHDQSSAPTPGLERFEIGYVYTRMLCRALTAYGPLKEYRREDDLYDALLSQKFWRRGKRAQWYERRAIVRNHILGQIKGAEAKREYEEKTLGILKEAITDYDTVTVWRPKLVRRIQALEKKLKVPVEDSTIVAGELREAAEVFVKGDKIPPLIVDEQGVPIDGPPKETITMYMQTMENATASNPPPQVTRKKLGKSAWKNKKGETVSVESIALERYAAEGYTGLHSETGILTMLYALLCWDIIFQSFPGAFETPFQNAPLDILEESFYYARRLSFEARFEEIKNGKGPEILETHDNLYRPKETFCIGVHWKTYAKKDLLEIATCLGGKPLAAICSLFAEDYRGRSSGAPDLVLWSTRMKKCKFVEVKGPNDKLQENQKMWIDALLGAGAEVDVCRVVDINEAPKPPLVTAGPSKKRKKGGSKKVEGFEGSEEEDYEQLDVRPDDLVDPEEIQNPSPSKRRRTS